MTYQHHKDLKEFLDILGLKEEPVGIFHTDTWTTVQKKIARSNQAWARKTEHRNTQ